VLGLHPALRASWLWATVGSESLLLALDLHETAALLLQVRGAFVLAKLVVVGLLPALPGMEPWILCGLVLASVAMSHAPAGVRYRPLAGPGSVHAACSRG
jgi:hypothetical protein